ncbi:MAG TPA: hydantoinase/oxoprolinase family protein [Planctomycetota bacterium]|nr:hydantoinase/oxoprolinase family protein [Planctomycetota bacterium]
MDSAPEVKRVGIDTGGTFTDLVVREASGEERVHKLPSTPDNPARAVIDGLRAALGHEPSAGVTVVHGTTVATNALLERRGARAALVTNEGFEDLIEIGRQTRPRIYELAIDRPPPLVPRELRFGVASRTYVSGEPERRVSDASLQELVEKLRAARVEAVAVSLLHSYAHPEEERRIGAALGGLGVPVTLSSELLPVVREYERTATAVANAYLAPLFARYLDDLGRLLGGARLRIMQSNGGSFSAARARREPVHVVLSGPAGGAIGALREGVAASFPRVISLDMGGTSTDVCVLDGRVEARGRTAVGGVPVAVPALDVHTVGAGGGSIAWRDDGGALRVGPRSAGAVPGPAAYRAGGVLPTLTDAHVVLGTMRADRFLGGRIALDRAAAREAVERLASSLRLELERTARGIVEVALAHMERALRVVTVQRGIDPRGFTLVAFGGAGPLHAVELGQRLGMKRALVPRDPGALSARGMLSAPVLLFAQRSVHRSADDHEALARDARELDAELAVQLASEGVAEKTVEVTALARYEGQAHELEVPFGARLAERFHEVHEARNGYRDATRPVEVVTLRARGAGPTPAIDARPEPLVAGEGERARFGREQVAFARGVEETWLLDRDLLRPGETVAGPAIIIDPTATTVVPPGSRATVDGLSNLVLEWS